MKNVKVLLSLAICTYFCFGAGIICKAASAVTLDTNKAVRIEAEDAEYTSPYAVVKDSNVSNGSYLTVPQGTAWLQSVNVNTKAEIVFNVDVNKDDVYFIWHRGRGVGEQVSSWTSIDDIGYNLLNYDKVDDWTWKCVGWYRLTEGKHEIKVVHRVDKVSIDCIEITADPNYMPGGGERFPVITGIPDENGNLVMPYALPAYTPPAEHPRIEFREKDLPRIRQNLTHPQNMKAYDELMRYADMDINEGILPPVTYGMSRNNNNNYTACIESNAFLWQLNGDKTRGLKAIKWAKNMIKTTYAVSGDDRSRDGMYAVYIAAKVYDWCYDLLTEEDKKFLESMMLARMTLCETGWPAVEYDTTGVNGHALESQLLRESLAAGIALYDERQDVYNIVAGRILEKIVPAHNITEMSTLQSEGPSYGYFRFQYQMECALLFKAMGYDNIFNEEAHRYALYGYFYITRPDGKKIRYADDANEALWGYANVWADPAFLVSALYKDPYMKDEYYRQGGAISTSFSGITPARFLILNDVNVGISTHKDLPLSTFSGFPQGYMMARTSWDEGYYSDALVCMMNIKQRYLPGHAHKDSGNFDIYYKGLLAVDSGTYGGSAENYDYSRRAIAHNTMLVTDDTGDWDQKSDFWIWRCEGLEDIISDTENNRDHVNYGKVLSYNFGPDIMKPAYTYMKGDMTNAYTDKVENFQRTFMFLNFFDDDYPGALMVFDNITASNPYFKKTWLLHTQEEPEINKENQTMTIRRTEFEYNAKMINQTLLPEDANYNVIGGEGHEFEIDGVNYPAALKHVAQESGNWRIELSPSTNQKQHYFLNVMQVGENDDSIAPLNAEIIDDNDDFYGVSIKDRVVYFKKDGNPTYKNVTVNDTAVSDNEERMYIVTGLAEGRWEIYNESGIKISSEYARDEHDSFSFTAKRGEYTLKWNYCNDIPERDLSLKGNSDEKPKKNIDVKIGNFFETLNPGFIDDENGTLYAPVKELLDRLEIKYIDNNTLSVTLNGNTYDKNTDGALVKDNVLYMEADKIISAFNAAYKYDPLGRVVNIYYSDRRVDNMFLKNYDEPGILKIVRMTGSAGTGNPAYMASDTSTDTYWYASGDGEWIMAELEKASRITDIQLYWHLGNNRMETFDILLSNDGENWITAFEGCSEKRAELGFDTVKINANGEYQFVKIIGHGNTENEINSLKEIKIHCLTENDKKTVPYNVMYGVAAIKDNTSAIQAGFDNRLLGGEIMVIPSHVSEASFELTRSARVELMTWKDMSEADWKSIGGLEGYTAADTNAFNRQIFSVGDRGYTNVSSWNTTVYKDYDLSPGETENVKFDNLDANELYYVIVKAA